MLPNLELYTSEYTATEQTNVVPINIALFNPAVDFLLVFINNVYASEDEYSLSANEQSIILTEPLTAGEIVDFLMFKTDGVDIDVSEFGAPQSRNEAILQNILGGTNLLLEPESRIEVLLMALLKHLNINASDNANVMAALDVIKTNWSSYETGISHISPVAAGGPVAGVIVWKYSDDYGAVLILSYHPMFPQPAYCRMFAGEWTTPYWL